MHHQVKGFGVRVRCRKNCKYLKYDCRDPKTGCDCNVPALAFILGGCK